LVGGASLYIEMKNSWGSRETRDQETENKSKWNECIKLYLWPRTYPWGCRLYVSLLCFQACMIPSCVRECHFLDLLYLLLPVDRITKVQNQLHRFHIKINEWIISWQAGES
jgi:hypothetical protein